MGKISYSWHLALKDAQDAINTGISESWRSLSKQLGIPRVTLQDGFFREYGITSFSEIITAKADGGESDISFVKQNGASIRIEESENISEIDFRSSRIVTLEQMLEICKVDLDIWEVERYLVNKWEVGAKDIQKDLEWQDGVVTGTVRSTGGLTVEPLFQIKVWLKRKKPESPEMSIHPITINIQLSKKPISRKHGIRTAAIIPDMQIGFTTEVNNATPKLLPYHDRQAIDIALQIVEMEEVDTVIYLGDILDLAEWSTHFLRSPDFFFNTQSAITEAAWWLSQFRMASQDAEHSLLEGNHELRIQTSVIQNLSAAYNIKTPGSKHSILSIPNMLGLDNINVNYVPGYPNNYIWLGDSIVCTHGNAARSAAGATVAKIVDEHNTTIIQGHTHRIEMVSRTIYMRDETRIIHAFSPGCLCRIDGSVPGSSARSQWQQGMAIVHFDSESENHAISVIPIRHGTAVHKGYMLKARDRLKDIQQDTNWNF